MVKIRGKQIKQKLKARDLAEARRKLREFKSDQAKIDPEAGRITVDALCDKFTAGMSAQAPKTIKRKEDIISAFGRSGKAYRPAPLRKPPSPDAKVFSVANAKKAIEAACHRLNLPAYTSRSFRRTFITAAIERGVDVKVIAEWQGHRDGGKLILDTYSHVRAAHSESMAKLMTLEKPDNVIQMEGAA